MTPLATRPLLALGFAATLAAFSVSSEPAQEPAFSVHPVAGRVSYFEGAGGNIGIWNGETGRLIIDSQYSSAREKVVNGVLDAGEGPVRYLINTHWHGDHVGNNAQLAGDAPILAHTNVRRRLASDPEIGGKVGGEAPRGAWPQLTFDDGIALHLEDEEIEVRHYPNAHTDGDSVVFFRTSGVVHMGDILFNRRFPFIDVESGGSVQGVLDALDALLAEVGEMKIIPGHGPLATRADLLAYRAMLADCYGRVKAAMAKGQGALEMRDAGLVDDYAKDWAWGFIDAGRFIDLLYASASR